ncbi:MAG: hypothetical protein JO163_00970, partial [Methylobacteriaceae bacterium]|nr:hypothetical protein [Methylobacteriaceae bacterium]
MPQNVPLVHSPAASPSEAAIAAPAPAAPVRSNLGALVLGSMGVVYGDIG